MTRDYSLDGSIGDARSQAEKDMESLREEFEGLSDHYLSREANRIDIIARQATNASARLRAEMMRRALVKYDDGQQ